jgi:hypothetical protein
MTSLAAVLNGNKHLVLTPSNRVQCTITKHEMPPKLEVVNQYLASKKYHAAVEWCNKSILNFQFVFTVLQVKI